MEGKWKNLRVEGYSICMVFLCYILKKVNGVRLELIG